MQKFNQALLSLEVSKNEINSKIKNGILASVETCFAKINEYKTAYAINDRKARSLLKKETLSLLDTKPCKYLDRAYSIALIGIKRGLNSSDINALLLLTPSTIENVLNYCTNAQIREIIECSDKEREEFTKKTLKSLKTRDVIVKTFEKKSR